MLFGTTEDPVKTLCLRISVLTISLLKYVSICGMHLLGLAPQPIKTSKTDDGALRPSKQAVSLHSRAVTKSSALDSGVGPRLYRRHCICVICAWERWRQTSAARCAFFLKGDWRACSKQQLLTARQVFTLTNSKSPKESSQYLEMSEPDQITPPNRRRAGFVDKWRRTKKSLTTK